MAIHRLTVTYLLTLLAAGVAPELAAAEDPLELFVGRWAITVSHIRPERLEVTYTEHYQRVLDGKYIRGETSRKPDGNYDIVFGTYDENADGYPFWVFSSTGSYSYLAPATWNARKRIMTWKNPPQFDISYESQCEFPSAELRSCYLIMKDWKGKVLSEMTWTAERLED